MNNHKFTYPIGSKILTFPTIAITIGELGDVIYVIAQTSAPLSYDGFGTLSLLETYGPGNEIFRIVLIREEQFNWQFGRYASGMHTPEPFPGETNDVAEHLWKRLTTAQEQA